MDSVRIGTLGAARISPMALLKPARRVAEATVVAVAARDRARAEKYAKKHGIPQVRPTYDDLIADPDIDAIYNPLPNGLHAEWTLKALDAGKHVLCEKPFTANVAEAREVADAAQASGKVVVEAFHWRYHPMAERMIEILRSGEIGSIQRIETAMCIPLPLPGDIRYRWDLAGGALMDTGCYAVSMLRHLSGEEPEVVSARATMARDQVDRAMTADLRLPSGGTGRIECSLFSRRLVKVGARIVGDKGAMKALNPVGPQYLHRLEITTPSGKRRERFDKTPTYVFQLQAFCAAVLEGREVPTPPEDAIANMAVIDAIYEAAGLKVRGT